MRRGPFMFLSPNNKGSFFSISPENQVGLNLKNPMIQAGDLWKAEEVLQQYKSFCKKENKKFDIRTFFGLPNLNLFLTPGEFGKKRIRGTSKMEKVNFLFSNKFI